MRQDYCIGINCEEGGVFREHDRAATSILSSVHGREDRCRSCAELFATTPRRLPRDLPRCSVRSLRQCQRYEYNQLELTGGMHMGGVFASSTLEPCSVAAWSPFAALRWSPPPRAAPGLSLHDRPRTPTPASQAVTGRHSPSPQLPALSLLLPVSFVVTLLLAPSAPTRLPMCCVTPPPLAPAAAASPC